MIAWLLLAVMYGLPFWAAFKCFAYLWHHWEHLSHSMLSCEWLSSLPYSLHCQSSSSKLSSYSELLSYSAKKENLEGTLILLLGLLCPSFRVLSNSYCLRSSVVSWSYRSSSRVFIRCLCSLVHNSSNSISCSSSSCFVFKIFFKFPFLSFYFSHLLCFIVFLDLLQLFFIEPNVLITSQPTSLG